MSPHHIVFLDRNAIRVPLRTPVFPRTWAEHRHTEPQETIERLAGATMAITNRVVIDAQTLDAVPSLELVAVSATGHDHVDVAACAARGVTVCNVRNWSISVPEHVFALVLALRRQLFAYRDAIAGGAWRRSPTYGVLLEPLPHTLAGSTLGIIGYGSLARDVERIGIAFGMRILIAERRGATEVRTGRTPFDETLRASDVLVVLAPLNDDTRGMIGANELGAMKSTALLVNCARGGIIDEHALADALRSGRIAGAATDVLSVEPPRDGNPLLDHSIPNLILTPHMAWASKESLETLATMLMDNLEAFAAGTPQNVVSP